MAEELLRSFFLRWGDLIEYDYEVWRDQVVSIELLRPLSGVDEETLQSWREGVEKLRNVLKDLRILVDAGVGIGIEVVEPELEMTGLSLHPGDGNSVVVTIPRDVLETVGEGRSPIETLERILRYLEECLPRLEEWRRVGTPWGRWLGKVIKIFAPPWSGERIDLAEVANELERIARDLEEGERVFAAIRLLRGYTNAVIIGQSSDEVLLWIEVTVPIDIANDAGVARRDRPSQALRKIAAYLRRVAGATQ